MNPIHRRWHLLLLETLSVCVSRFTQARLPRYIGLFPQDGANALSRPSWRSLIWGHHPRMMALSFPPVTLLSGLSVLNHPFVRETS